MNIKVLGEFGLINRVKEFIGETEGVLGIGDDCAIIPSGDREILISTDTLVENVHFLSNVNPFFLGRKSLAVNISDVAAMAGTPRWAFLSISLKEDLEVKWIDEFLNGFVDCASEFDVKLLGGDTTLAKELVINVTIIGENGIGESIKRSGAKPGDFVAVTGKIGCSYSGLKALRNNINGYEELKMKHLNPNPRVFEAQLVKPYATAMIDVSDGLIQDCNHICEESGVGMVLDWDRIPFCESDLCSKEEMLCGGEDYELVVCIDKNYGYVLDDLRGFTLIGRVTEGKGVVVLKGGEALKLENCGYRHF